jgi:hypothetical protein
LEKIAIFLWFKHLWLSQFSPGVRNSSKIAILELPHLPYFIRQGEKWKRPAPDIRRQLIHPGYGDPEPRKDYCRLINVYRKKQAASLQKPQCPGGGLPDSLPFLILYI